MPVTIKKATGFLCTMFQTQAGLTAHFLAEDYDTDIDHELDAMRFHRSRVNFINKVAPVGTESILEVEADAVPTVYTPFHPQGARVETQGSLHRIILPDGCAYAIVKFTK